jgi:hypothetical protein
MATPNATPIYTNLTDATHRCTFLGHPDEHPDPQRPTLRTSQNLNLSHVSATIKSEGRLEIPRLRVAPFSVEAVERFRYRV